MTLSEYIKACRDGTYVPLKFRSSVKKEKKPIETAKAAIVFLPHREPLRPDKSALYESDEREEIMEFFANAHRVCRLGRRGRRSPRKPKYKNVQGGARFRKNA